jgi:hypothetical protein
MIASPGVSHGYGWSAGAFSNRRRFIEYGSSTTSLSARPPIFSKGTRHLDVVLLGDAPWG